MGLMLETLPSSHLDVLLGLCLPQNYRVMGEKKYFVSQLVFLHRPPSHPPLPTPLVLVQHTPILCDVKHKLVKLSISCCRLKQALSQAAGLPWTRKISLSWKVRKCFNKTLHDNGKDHIFRAL